MNKIKIKILSIITLTTICSICLVVQNKVKINSNTKHYCTTRAMNSMDSMYTVGYLNEQLLINNDYANGWQTINNERVYFENGLPFTGELYENEEWIFLVNGQKPVLKVTEEPAARKRSLEEVINEYLTENNIVNSNVAYSYYNINTDTTIEVNSTKSMVAASTYKLPLNMLIQEEINNKQLTNDSLLPVTILGISDYEDELKSYITSYGNPAKLSDLQYTSIVYSSNVSAYSLMSYFNSRGRYYNRILKYGDGGISVDNVTTAAYFMQVLKYLYTHSNEYQQIIDYLLIASPNSYYTEQNNTVPIAHKYGHYLSAINDVAIVYDKNPYLIALFTNNLDYSDFTNIAYLIHQWHIQN